MQFFKSAPTLFCLCLALSACGGGSDNTNNVSNNADGISPSTSTPTPTHSPSPTLSSTPTATPTPTPINEEENKEVFTVTNVFPIHFPYSNTAVFTFKFNKNLLASSIDETASIKISEQETGDTISGKITLINPQTL